MSDVSVVGLGSMGSALARALVGAGREVTVWNRTSAKADALVKAGAVAATTVAEAAAASPVTIVCVDDYSVTRAILGTDEAEPGLAGRVLVQLSTGSPQEARDSEEWARANGFEYLDGALICFPEHIGTPDALLVLAGAESAFHESESLLKVLAENSSYLSDRVGAASALDLALWSFAFGALVGALHGARICESEGLPANDFGVMLAEVMLPVLDPEVRHLGENIQSNQFANPAAALKLYAAMSARMAQQADDVQINAELPAFLSGFFQKGIAAGYEEEELAAMIKVLRES